MRRAGLRGISRRKGTRTTVRDARARAVPDLVERDFTADAPDRLWVADITYIPTWAGFLYLAVVLDAFSRRVVGWSMANHLRTQLVLDALDMALWQRRPDGVIHHSDQGSQYSSCSAAMCTDPLDPPGSSHAEARMAVFEPTIRAFIDKHNENPKFPSSGPNQAADDILARRQPRAGALCRFCLRVDQNLCHEL